MSKKYYFIAFLFNIFFLSYLSAYAQYLVPSTGSSNITTCSGNVMDHAGAGDYSNSVNGTLTIFPQTAGSFITLNFTSFQLESCCDYVRIYDGINTSATLLGSWNGSNSPGTVYASNTSGALTINFSSDGSIVYSGFDANITCATSVPQPDLTLESPNLSGSTNVVAGGTVTANCTVRNLGLANASSSNIGYYLSTDNVFDASDTYLAYLSGSTVTAGGTSTRSAYLTIPSSTAPGTYYIIYYADYTAQLSETDETNNTTSLQIVVSPPQYDLVIKLPYVSTTTIGAGQSTSINSYLYNYGNSTVSSASIGYYLSTDLMFDAGDVYLNYSAGSNISSGSYYYASTTVTIPSATTPGNYYILFVADYTNAIQETIETNNTNAAAITVGTSTVDLTVFSATTPTVITLGNAFSVSFNAVNQGNQTVSSTNAAFYLSTDSVWDAADSWLGNQTLSNMYANNYYTYNSPSLTVPTSFSPGNYYLLVYIDYTGGISENNENNNVFPVSILAQSPVIDLYISSGTTFTTSYAAGSYVSASCYIANSGNASASSSNVGTYLSTDVFWDASDVYLLSTTGSGLAGGASAYRNTSFTIPASTTAGNYYILYYADYSNAVTEGNETNNVLYSPITINPSGADLIITSPYAPSYALAGNSISVNSYINNLGSVSAASSNIGYYLSADNVWDASDVYLNYYSGTALNPGSSSYRSLSLSIPPATTVGTYYIMFFADYTGAVAESNENNNVSSLMITIGTSGISSPDLLINNTPSGGGTITYPGSSLYTSGYVYNAGGASASSSNVGYYLSTDMNWDASDTYLGYSSGGSLSSATSSYRSYSITIPIATTPGNYYLLYYADYTGVVTESLESNNVYPLQITVNAASVDLQIQSFSVTPTNTSPGSVVSSSCYIANTGTSPSSTSNIGYYLSADQLWDASDVYLASSTGTTLSGGATSYRYPSLTIPAATSPGQYYILFYADYSGNEAESNESNNIANVAVIVAAPVIDLKILANTLSTSMVAPGNSLTAYGNIHNTGNAAASSSNMGYYLSTDSAFSASDVYLGYYSGNTLGGNTYSSRSKSLTIPVATTPGNYFLLQYADYTGQVSENVETNNVVCNALTVAGNNTDADLLLLASSLSVNQIVSGNSLSVSYSIANDGSSFASSSNTGYYLSADSIWSASDTYLSSYTGSSMSPYSVASRSGSITIPSSTPTGNYFIIFYADYSANVPETDEVNNTVALPISIQAPVIDLYIQNHSLSTTNVAAGYTTNASSYIYNSGNNAASSSNVGYYLSADTTYSASDVYLNYTYGGTLSANTSSSRSATLTIPASTTPGNYYILFYADYSAQVAEVNETNNVKYLAVTVSSPSVDFTLNTPSLSSGSVVAGNNVSAYVYIRNNGNITATYSNIGYYLSADTVWSASDTYLTYGSGSNLAAGANSYRTATLTIPSSTPAGNYYIIYYADYSNQVTESNENNNTKWIALAIQAAIIDLTITSQSGPTTGTAGNSYTASCYINNTGNSIASVASVGFYLSANTVFDASDVFLGYQSGSNLSSGSSSYRSATITIPSSTTPGNYYILYYADYLNAETESNETNNVNYTSLTVQAAMIDLTITSPYSPTVLTSGVATSISCYIYNQGNSTSPSSNVGYYLSANNAFDASDVYLAYTSGTSLNASSSSYRSGTVTVPVGTTPGTYYILFYADYSGNVSEVLETNNISSVQVTVQNPSVDLTITSPYAPSTASPGSSYSINCYIYNQGNSASVSSNVGYYLSTDNVFDASDVYLGYSSGGSLSGGSSSYKSYTVNIPSSTTPGNYYLLFYADYSGVETETNETNNVSYSAISIQNPVIDLVMQSPYAASNMIPGSTYSVNAYIYNQGTASSSSSNVGYYLSSNTVFDASDTYLAYSSGGTLNSGSSSYRSASITIPSGTPNGTYYILYYADYNNNVTESVETNNVTYSTVSVQNPFIDLLIQYQSTQTNMIAGQIYSVSSYIYNQGNTNSTSGNVGYYLSTDMSMDASDVYLGYYAGGSVYAGNSNFNYSNITIPAGTPAGSYYILFFADYNNNETESNETNNVSSYSVSIQSPFVDLLITNQYSTYTLYPGNSYTMDCYINNQGNSPSSSSNVGYYLSTNNTFDTSDVFLGSSTGYSLAANYSEYRYLSAYIPVNTSPGTYYILYYADYTNIIGESVETNNVAYYQVEVQNPNPDLVVTNAGTSASMTAGLSYTVSCYIYNQGSLTAGSSNLGYYLSQDAGLDSTDIYLGSSSGTSLSSGSSAYKSATITIPSGTATGTYNILFVADYTNSVVESVENNNINPYSVNIQNPTIDLVVTNPTSALVMVPGSSYSVSCSVHNQGNYVASSSSVGFYLSSDLIFDATDVFLASTTGSTLNSGATATRTATVTIPSGTASGQYYILYFADYNAQVNETIETNNINFSSVNIVSPGVDLLISNLNVPNSMTPSNTYNFSCDIFNQGTVASSTSDIGFYLSTDNLLDAGDMLLNSISGNALSGTTSDFRSTSVTIPVSATPGNYFIICKADYSNNESETDEANNATVQSVVIQAPFADLIPDNPVANATMSGGNTYTVSVDVFNAGNTPVAGCSVGYYLSSDVNYDTLDVMLASSSGGAINAGGSDYQFVNITIPQGTPNGNYYLLFFADHQDTISETIETNNIAYSPVYISPDNIDLYISNPSVAPNTIVSPGDVITLSNYIYNGGSTQSATSNTGYYLSADVAYDTTDILLGSLNSGLLSGGFSSHYQNLAVTIPSGTPAGSYYIIYFADHNNQETEFNENNNISAVSITINSPFIDLEVSTTNGPSGSGAGNTFTVGYTVMNTGGVSSASSNTGIYLSSDSIYDTADQLIGFNNAGGIGASGTQNYNTSVTIPSGAQAGQYYLLYYADYNNNEIESNETNNILAMPFAVLSNGIDLFVSGASMSSNWIAPGGASMCDVIISNSGSYLSIGSYLGIYLSADTLLDAGDTNLLSAAMPSVSGGANYNSVQNVIIPSTTNAGNMYLLFMADDHFNNSEVNENNNLSYLPVTILSQGVDLTVTSVSSADTVANAGAGFYFEYELANIGLTNSSAINTAYYLSADMVVDVNDVYLSSASSPAINGASVYNATANLIIPASVAAGNYYLLTNVDYLNAQTEDNENNNVFAYTLKVNASGNVMVVPAFGANSYSNCSGTIYDHAGAGNDYSNNTNGYSVIYPPVSTDKIRLVFTQLEVDSCCDSVYVYDGAGISAPLIGAYTAIPDTITATNATGALTVRFQSNSNNVNHGFAADISCVSPQAIKEMGEPDFDLNIYPNPNAGTFNLDGKIRLNTDYTILIENALGQSVYSKVGHSSSGVIKENITTGAVRNGIYILKIMTSNKVITKKVIIEN